MKAYKCRTPECGAAASYELTVITTEKLGRCSIIVMLLIAKLGLSKDVSCCTILKCTTTTSTSRGRRCRRSGCGRRCSRRGGRVVPPRGAPPPRHFKREHRVDFDCAARLRGPALLPSRLRARLRRRATPSSRWTRTSTASASGRATAPRSRATRSGWRTCTRRWRSSAARREGAADSLGAVCVARRRRDGARAQGGARAAARRLPGGARLRQTGLKVGIGYAFYDTTDGALDVLGAAEFRRRCARRSWIWAGSTLRRTRRVNDLKPPTTGHPGRRRRAAARAPAPPPTSPPSCSARRRWRGGPETAAGSHARAGAGGCSTCAIERLRRCLAVRPSSRPRPCSRSLSRPREAACHPHVHHVLADAIP